jgi:hypothetical protein
MADADIASAQVGFLFPLNKAEFTVSASITLAPQSVVAAMGIDLESYCPLHSLLHGLSTTTVSTGSWYPASAYLSNLRIAAFDLPHVSTWAMPRGECPARAAFY